MSAENDFDGNGRPLPGTEAEATRAKRRVLIKRALRVALAAWADDQELFDQNENSIGMVEWRGLPGDGLVDVIRPDGEVFGFRIEVL